MTILPLAKIGLMMNLALVLFFIIAVLIIFIILIQKGKGGGLSSAFGGGGAGGLLGAKSAGPMLTITIVLMSVFLILAILLNKFYIPKASENIKQQTSGSTTTGTAGNEENGETPENPVITDDTPSPDVNPTSDGTPPAEDKKPDETENNPVP